MTTFNMGDIARFRPRTVRQFALFNIALRLDDVSSFPHYLDSAASIPTRDLYAAAREAERDSFRSGSRAGATFLTLIAARREAA